MEYSLDRSCSSMTLLTDLYQLTMAYGYYKQRMADKEAVFHLTFRKNPFQGGYTIACGLAYVIDYLRNFRFQSDDLEYLAGLRGGDAQPLFSTDFLDYLNEMRFCCDVAAIPEGTVVFPQQPLVRVKGPVIQCQLIESALLNMINFQSLIATKAARVCSATGGQPVLEFGLRRAQGIDGSLAASRAAYIGGVAATSNVLAGKMFGIPVKGTHAHSWVMCFDSELESFQAYAESMPNNCVLLVDTYDTVEGVRNAITVGRALRDKGHKLDGIRLDSGDLAYLSIQARELLDEAGFHDTAIVASNDLDEHIIASLKRQGATITVWGVGTKLATAYDQPALGGVYKLSAIREKGGSWDYKVKLSEQHIKITTPGMHQVRRFTSAGEHIGDAVYDIDLGFNENWFVDPLDMTRRKRMPADATHEDLLVPIFEQGAVVYAQPALSDTRARVQQQLAQFHGGIKRFVHPHQYPVGLEPNLHKLKTELILKARGWHEKEDAS